MKKVFSLIVAILLCFCLLSCKKNEKITEDGENYTSYTAKTYSSTSHFNSITNLTLFSNYKKKENVNKFNEVKKIVIDDLTEIENTISTSVEGSDVYKFNNANAGEKVEISSLTYFLLERAKEYHALTGGAFNPSVYNLCDLWGFTARFKGNYAPKFDYDRENYKTNLPSQEYIDGFKKLCNFNDLVLTCEGEKFYAIKPTNTVVINGVTYSMKIDLGGLGKGYAVDLLKEKIKEKGFNFGYLSLGNSSIALLKSVGDKKAKSGDYDFNLNLVNPVVSNKHKESSYAVLFSFDDFVSTSGDYVKCYDLKERRYCHVISSETGEPIQTKIHSVTIVGKSALETDALSTAIIVMGKDRAVSFIREKLSDCKVVFLKSELADYTVYTNVDALELKCDFKMEKI